MDSTTCPGYLHIVQFIALLSIFQASKTSGSDTNPWVQKLKGYDDKTRDEMAKLRKAMSQKAVLSKRKNTDPLKTF